MAMNETKDHQPIPEQTNPVPQRPSRWRPYTPRRRTLLIVAICVCIFLSGLITGGIVSVVAFRHEIVTGMRLDDVSVDRIAKRLETVMNLTPEQAQQLRSVLETKIPQLRRDQDQYVAAMIETLREIDREISPLLNEEQRDQWKRRFGLVLRSWQQRLSPNQERAATPPADDASRPG